MIRLSVQRRLAGVTLLSLFLVLGCQKGWNKNKVRLVVEEMTDLLDLDAPQKEQLRRLTSRLSEKAESFREERSQMMDEILQELRSDSLGQTRLNASMDRKKAQLEEISGLFVSSLTEFHAALTVKQRQKLAVHLHKMRDRHKT